MWNLWTVPLHWLERFMPGSALYELSARRPSFCREWAHIFVQMLPMSVWCVAPQYVGTHNTTMYHMATGHLFPPSPALARNTTGQQHNTIYKKGSSTAQETTRYKKQLSQKQNQEKWRTYYRHTLKEKIDETAKFTALTPWMLSQSIYGVNEVFWE